MFCSSAQKRFPKLKPRLCLKCHAENREHSTKIPSTCSRPHEIQKRNIVPSDLGLDRRANGWYRETVRSYGRMISASIVAVRRIGYLLEVEESSTYFGSCFA